MVYDEEDILWENYEAVKENKEKEVHVRVGAFIFD